jgi:beta-barrel assembly-enhancing protease
MRITTSTLVGLLIVLCLILVPGCRTPSTSPIIDAEQEKTIGDWAAAQLQSESMGPTDPTVSNRVNAIVERLEAATPLKIEPTILVSDSNSYQAASLPGGWIVISAKMVQFFDGDPDALAGILAHEIAHVRNDDAMRQMTDALGADTMLNMTTEGKYSDASNVAVELLNFPHDINDEYRADSEGVQIATAAGYDPRGILTAINLLKNADNSSNPVWLQVHPLTSKRIKFLMNDIAACTHKAASDTSGIK